MQNDHFFTWNRSTFLIAPVPLPLLHHDPPLLPLPLPSPLPYCPFPSPFAKEINGNHRKSMEIMRNHSIC